MNKKFIIYIVIMFILLIIGIVAFTKKDYSGKYQTEISCQLNNQNIELYLEKNNDSYYIYYYPKDVNENDLFAGNTIEEAFKNLEAVKDSLIVQGAFCK